MIHGGFTINNRQAHIAQVSIGCNAVQLAPQRPGRGIILIRTQSTVPVYLGGPNVTAANGFMLQSPDGKIWDSVEADYADAVYAICPTGTATLYVLETG
jgi:hypothetical protein